MRYTNRLLLTFFRVGDRVRVQCISVRVIRQSDTVFCRAFSPVLFTVTYLSDAVASEAESSAAVHTSAPASIKETIDVTVALEQQGSVSWFFTISFCLFDMLM